jgi:GT2 family glycosyltransferase
MLKILTLNWEGKDKLEKLYPTLINSLKGIDYEFYIKDNGSKDGSVDLGKIWNNNKLHIIPYPHNRDNFSEGVNFLFKEANPNDNDLILLLNNDVIFNDSTSIKNMISIMEKDKSVGVVGARQLYTGTNKIQHAGVVFIPFYDTPMHFRAGEVADDNSKLNRTFQAITGSVLITRTDIFKAAGQMPIQQRWAFDDVDFCLSVHYNLHKKIVYCGNTNIYHEESASLKKNPVNKLFLQHNLKTFLGKWHGKYSIDRDIYLTNPHHNLYQG